MLDNSYEYHAVSNAWSCVHNHAALCRDVTTVRGMALRRDEKRMIVYGLRRDVTTLRGMARRRDDCARHGSAT
jgi:hypothetical protein